MNMNNTWIRLAALIAICYLLFVVGKTLYQSYQVHHDLELMAAEIADLKESNKKLEADILYYQSDSYKERIARERLGLQKPGEKVMVILPEQKQNIKEKDPYNKLSNPEKWWQFFFKS
jgi:cell division protein FtsB